MIYHENSGHVGGFPYRSASSWGPSAPDPQHEVSVLDRQHCGHTRLKACDVSKSFGKRHVLRNVNVDVHIGEIVAVVGANGAGKSTFLKICAGLLSPDQGQVLVNGTIGYCPQVGGTLDFLHPDEHFVLFGRGCGLSRRVAVERGHQLASELDWCPDPNVQARQLFGGTRQKLNVVLALLGDPDILLMDEPYQGFDKGTYTEFWQVIWRQRSVGRAVMVITHMLNALDQVDQVLDLTPVEEGRHR